MDSKTAIRRRGLKETGEVEWKVVTRGFDPLAERGVEAVFSVANGRYGVRAAVEEGNPASNPMVIVAGVYVPTHAPGGETLLTIEDPARFDITIDGRPLNLSGVRTMEHVRELDMRRGVSRRCWSFTDGGGRVWRWESLRAASVAEEGCYLYELRLALVKGRPAQLILSLPSEVIFLAESQDARTELISAGDSQDPHLLRETAMIRSGRTQVVDGSVFALVREDEPFVMDSASSVFGTEDAAEKKECDFMVHLSAHQRVWDERWRTGDVAVAGDPDLQRAVRFAAFQMLSSAGDDNGRTSVGPRALTGRAYHGHVFWDTEIFVLPFLTLVWPEAARSCLLYRHRTLNAARHRARSYGYEGALYAWESTETGDDRTPESVVLPSGAAIRVLNGEQENHISADVPYAVVRYWEATGDDAFMLDYGAEILLECARFWCSRVSPEGNRYSIRQVIGPDEYHEAVDNNAYTNAMARWVLLQAEAYVEGLRAADADAADRLLRRLGIRAREPREWREVGERISRSSFLADELVEQFDGFLELGRVDVASYRRAGVPVDMAVGHSAVQRLQTTKQADVLMALWLLPEVWTEASARRNLAYYEPITAHTSSLSPPAHALLAAWLRDEALWRTYCGESIRVDLGDGFHRAAGGVHLGSLGGLWQAVVHGLGGLRISPERLGFDPFLPSAIDSLSFALRWRGRIIRARVSADRRLGVEVEGEPCQVRVNRESRVIRPGAPEEFPFDSAITYWSAVQNRESSDG